MGAILYRLSHHEFAGQSFLRWLQIALLLWGGAALLNWLPGGRPAMAAALLVVAALVAANHYWRQRDFITFAPEETPLVTPATLPSEAKLPIWASGYFSVENRHRHFTWLQGFFRTFPSREHAVICLKQPSRLLGIGKSPAAETGMWYSFFKPEDVEEVRWGKIHFGPEQLTGLVISYTVHIPKRGWLRPAKDVHKHTYLACPEEEDARSILADLLYDRYQAEAASQRSPNGVAHKHPQDEWDVLHG